MPDSATVYLPVGTYVSISCFTNASYAQQVTIAYENGTSVVLTGSGEHNNPIPNGSFSITTPSTSSSPLGYAVTVTILAKQPNGQWVGSQVMQGSCSVMYFSLEMVVSEDAVDNDWNDAVVQFNWWVPPSGRSLVRAAQIERAKAMA